jgi:peptide/nickel transport system substrate-binding protein
MAPLPEARQRPPAVRPALALACLLAAACARRGERLPPGVLAVTEDEPTAIFVRNFNPLLEAGNVRWPTRRAMYEPLLVFNPLRGEYVPWLAESYRWNDDRTELRFTIRRGVRWSDGTPFTSADVVFTFELLARHKGLDLRELWRHLRRVSAPDEHTVVVELARRHVPALEPVAHQPIVPAHVWSKVADPVAFPNEDPVATGPFTEVRFFSPQAYEIGRNPHYWQPGRPGPQALRFRAFPANDQEILALLHDELDWAGTFLPAVERLYVRRDPQHHRWWFPPIGATVFLYPNTARPPLDDVRVRKALSLAIDRKLLVDVAMHGYAGQVDATALSDAFARFRDPQAPAPGDWVAFDPARAERLLDQAGLVRGPDGWRRGRDGAALALALEVPAGFSDWVAAAQIVRRGLRRVGLDVALRASEHNTWWDRLQSGEFTLSVGWSEVATTPWGFYRALMSTETRKPPGQPAAENWHRFALAEADTLLAALSETDEPGRERALVAELGRLFAAHAPAVPLFVGPSLGEFSTARFTGFPDAQNPYAPLSPSSDPQSLLVLTRLEPR